jgi:SAM-dependent methyltransferase
MRAAPEHAVETDPELRALASARWRHEYEQSLCLFDKYFPQVDTTAFRGARMLDLGCFTGGRLVYWCERYGCRGDGIDVDPQFARAGTAFAAERGVDARFTTGFAESLPYPDASFDYIVSYDVIEHVRSVAETLKECSRVLKPGGRLMCVFPTLYQPLEAHLGNVTGWHGLHWLFPHKAIREAYLEIMRERGEPTQLQPWERLPSLNGITVAKFRRLIADGWLLRSWGTAPIFSDGRRADRPVFKALRAVFALPAKLPVLEELFLGRVCCVLEKPAP